MCANTCQTFPHINDARELIHCFFKLYSRWEWPNPICLNLGNLSESEWNPIVSVQDSRHLMPILTPFQNQNCATQVTFHSLQQLQIEFRRAYKICKKIGKGKLSFEALFTSFDPQSHFTVAIEVLSFGCSCQEHTQYALAVETCVRRLLQLLSDKIRDVSVRPCVRRELSKPQHRSEQQVQVSMFSILFTDQKNGSIIDVSPYLQSFVEWCR